MDLVSLPKWPFEQDPFSVQKEAINKSYGKEGYGFFIDKGLGKTAIALAEALNLHDEGEVQGIIVICPNSLKMNWKNEATKWKANLHVYIWPECKDEVIKEPFLVVMNYDALLFSGFDFIFKILAHSYCYMVFDESSAIKNPRAKRTNNSLLLARHAKYIRVMTGTPMSNGPHELWSQLKAIRVPMNRNYFAFRHNFCVMGGFQGKQVKGYKNEAELAELITPHVFQASKDEWGKDLPPKLYTSHYVEMDNKQKDAYKTMMNEFYVNYQEGMLTVNHAVTSMMKLQQISSGYVIDEEGNIQQITNKSPKIDVLKEIVDELDEKIIVFARFRHSVNMLQEAFPSASVLRGGMKPEEIEHEKDRFNNTPTRMLISQLQVGKFGHTLIGNENDRCRTICFFENDYSLETRSQAEDRIHRWGADKKVLYIDLISSEADQKIVDALIKKKNMVEAVLGCIRSID